MNTPTEAQLNDPKWWDENAPEGATHVCLCSGGSWQWMKINLSGAFNYYWHERFSQWVPKESSAGSQNVERPTTPPAPEWDGEGLPPVGVECECMRHGLWVKCEVRAHGEDHACPVAFVQTEFECLVHDERMFRPIRTKEQREREEILSKAEALDSGLQSTREFLNRLYDAGMLRKAGAE